MNNVKIVLMAGAVDDFECGVHIYRSTGQRSMLRLLEAGVDTARTLYMSPPRMRSNAVGGGGVLYFKLGVGRCSYDASTTSEI